MIDLFHLQLIKGNITNTLNDLKSHIGHVQVSENTNTNRNTRFRAFEMQATTHAVKMIFGMGAKKRLISEQYLIFFSFIFFAVSFFCPSLWLSFSTFASHTEYVCTNQIWWWWWCYCWSFVSFYGAFVVFVRSTVALLFHLVYFFCSISRPLALYLALVWWYKNESVQCLFVIPTPLYISLPVCKSLYIHIIIGTWQVGGEFLFDLILRNIHFEKCWCACLVFMLLLLFFSYTFL